MIENKIISYVPLGGPKETNALTLYSSGILPIFPATDEAIFSTLNIPFGVSFVGLSEKSKSLSSAPSLIIIPPEMGLEPFKKTIQIFVEIKDVADLSHIQPDRIDGIIIKGNEAAHQVGEDSAFILFQKVRKQITSTIPIWVQGGMGFHISVALLMTGAAGVVMDSQLSLFPELQIPSYLQKTYRALNGSETKTIAGHRVLVRPNSPKLPSQPTYTDLKPLLGETHLDSQYLPLGEGIGHAASLASHFNTLSDLVLALRKQVSKQKKQIARSEAISPENSFCKEYGIEFPIAQGPMTRVSDVPEFALEIAKGGALPFLALSLLKGEKAENLIRETKQKMEGKPWGIGILGFTDLSLREEQLRYIEAAKPPVVLIAGGRPSQAISLEKQGIKTFLHAPSVALLDLFIKEGARRFVFEGRECGGHVGPSSGFTLWEQQIERLLKEKNLTGYSILFAGGITDSFATALLSTLSAPLLAKGATIGVLMGTAYLFTKEAVESGAIVFEFQKQLLGNRSRS